MCNCICILIIQEAVDKYIPSKTNRSVASVPWITSEIRRNIQKRNKIHAKAKKTDSSKLRFKFQELRQQIKADIKKQHDLYVNKLFGDIKVNPKDFYQYTNSQRKDNPGVTGEKMEITFSPTGDRTRSTGLKVLHSTTSL